MFETDADEGVRFMERFEIDSDQFMTVAMFFSIMQHEPEVIINRPETLKVTRAELESLRDRVFDQFLLVAKGVDHETIEEIGGLAPTCGVNDAGEPFIGTFSHERLTRAAIRVFDGMSSKEAAERAGSVTEAVEIIKDIITRKILYMSALATKAHPDWNALDILKNFQNIEQFAEWHDEAISFLNEDEEACENEEEAN